MYTEDLLDEIQSKDCTRDSVVLVYKLALRNFGEIDWEKVNTAIMKRWSRGGLLYIKNKAWKEDK